MKLLRITGLALIGLLLMVASGCGGGSSNNNSATTQTTPTQTTTNAAAPSTAGVTLNEYKITPSDVVIKKGGTISVKNDGKIVHNLTVEKGPDPKTKSQKLAGTPSFPPGQTEKLPISLSPGKYVLVCTIAGHRELGMTGTLTVK